MALTPLDSKCLWCFQELKDPVSLDCEHRFCSVCLSDFWAKNKPEACPKCTRTASEDRIINFYNKRKERISSETNGEVGGELQGSDQGPVQRIPPDSCS